MNRDSCLTTDLTTDRQPKAACSSKGRQGARYRFHWNRFHWNQSYWAVLLIVLIGCSDGSDTHRTAPEKRATQTAQTESFTEIGWNDLTPKVQSSELQAPTSSESPLPDPNAIAALAHSQMAAGGADVNTGGADANINDDMSAISYDMNRYIVPELNGKRVKVPGFVVPIDIDDQQVTTRFFLVPYFGACIHVPPPAPNQIIYVNYPEGLTLEALYQPYWIKGTLLTGMTSNEIATALYLMHANEYERYALQ